MHLVYVWCMFTRVFVHMCANARVCVRMWRVEVSIGCLCPFLFAFLLEIGSLTAPGASVSLELTSSDWLWSPPLTSSSVLGLYVCAAVPDSNVGAKDINSVPYACLENALVVEPSFQTLDFSVCQLCANFMQMRREEFYCFSAVSKWVEASFPVLPAPCSLSYVSTVVLTQWHGLFLSYSVLTAFLCNL